MIDIHVALVKKRLKDYLFLNFLKEVLRMHVNLKNNSNTTTVIHRGLWYKVIIKMNVTSSPVCKAFKVYFSYLLCYLVGNPDIPIMQRYRGQGKRLRDFSSTLSLSKTFI